MSLQVVPITECWGFDTSGKITEAFVQVMLSVDMVRFWPAAPKGPPKLIGRYFPLPGNPVGNDLTAEELELLTDHGFTVVAFQHVRSGSWTASEEQGRLDGIFAANYAKNIGYAGTIIKDCESVANPGPQALAAMQAFRDAVVGLGLPAAAYNGFDPGLTPEQFAQLGLPIARDAGDRTSPPGRGFAYRQGPQVTLGGMAFDPAWAGPDLTGATLSGMANVEDQTGPDSGDPHLDPSGTVIG